MEAKGLDPYADRASEAAPTDEPDAPAEPEQAPEAAAPEATDEAPAQAAPAQAEPEVQPSTAPQTFNVQVPADLAAQRAELLKAKGEAMKQLMDGEIDAEQYATTEADITGKLEDLAAARIRAETLADVNRQQAENHQSKAIRQLIERTKGEVNYAADAKAQKQFDVAMAVIGADPDNASLGFDELIEQAHKVVAAQRGVAVSNKPQAKPAPDRTPPKPPITLSGLPTAAASGTQSVSQVVGRLAGDELEKAFDSMSDAEFKKLLRG
jgi:hypothetical protein